MRPDFVHLHTHSHYSLLGALPKVPDLVARAKKEGLTALALTDNGNLYGAIEFYKECQKQGLKPVLGLDAYLAPRGRKDKQSGIDNRPSRLVLLAKNEEGYRNLLKIVTLSNLEGFYYKPRLDRELLEAHAGGLIAVASFLGSELSAFLAAREASRAREVSRWYKKLFSENFFLEVGKYPELDIGLARFRATLNFASDEGLKTAAGREIFYLSPADREAWQTLALVGGSAEAIERSSNEASDFSFYSREAMAREHADCPETLITSSLIAEQCDLKLKIGSWVFPDVATEPGENYDQTLRKLVERGLREKGLALTDEVRRRVEHELKVIANKGYGPYFLVVADLLDYAHKRGILTTIRGSVAGSLVTYLAGITNVNPLDYNLPFERFLNPERPSPPDIDMDFADNRREEMIEYVKVSYGADKVAQIGTFGTMMARGAVRDVARAQGFPYSVGDRISKLIPMGSQGFPMTIDRAMELVPELKKIYREEREGRQIIDMAKKIEGCARHISVHAAGVVISPRPLIEFVPLQLDPKGGKLITQYDMHAVEDAGLLKFDFLGIKNLSILADSVTLVKKLENREIDIEGIPLDDKRTFETLSRGETVGLFQLNGAGLTKFLCDLRPTSIHDINAMVALYRPGPMESIPRYIERKNNPRTASRPKRPRSSGC
ncbi:MAG: DNA polymerase III subunit alpha [Candidatus Taylorbacteria bacterium]|nr:DNA polymerase III subunit alpha [Candidatus Taylorbacteria bacterium]